MLAKPRSGEKLWVHLVASKATVSAILVRQDGADQHPVYYVIYLFKGDELCCTSLEKLTLGLILVAWGLRHYFCYTKLLC